MKQNYFFVHIPKTAGTSFREVLQKHQSVRMLYDYGKESAESNPELVRTRPHALTPESEIFHADKLNFLCGHVYYRKYAHCVPPERVISIVRNPVERVISEYQHLRRDAGYAHSFTAFCQSQVQQNKQWKMLQGADSGRGALVGLTSHYGYFLELFSSRLQVAMRAVSANKAPSSDVQARFELTPEDIKAAYVHNRKDVEFFLEVVDEFAASVRRLGYRTVPSADAKGHSRIKNDREIVGWFPCGAKDCYFVEIRVNDEFRAVTSLNQHRKDVHEKGLSENPVCGFSYPLPLLGVEEGDEVYVGIRGAAGFDGKLKINGTDAVCQSMRSTGTQ